eukprot:5279155-Pleurochrysis_carterae.AAC.2
MQDVRRGIMCASKGECRTGQDVRRVYRSSHVADSNTRVSASARDMAIGGRVGRRVANGKRVARRCDEVSVESKVQLARWMIGRRCGKAETWHQIAAHKFSASARRAEKRAGHHYVAFSVRIAAQPLARDVGIVRRSGGIGSVPGIHPQASPAAVYCARAASARHVRGYQGAMQREREKGSSHGSTVSKLQRARCVRLRGACASARKREIRLKDERDVSQRASAARRRDMGRGTRSAAAQCSIQ